MRVSRRTARVVRAVVPFLTAERYTGSVHHLAALTVNAKDRVIAREVVRRDLARRARADIRTYWAMRANDGALDRYDDHCPTCDARNPGHTDECAVIFRGRE